jgi:predicted DNA repair protein MutK
MAGGSLLTLLDDIASILDDVAVMTKTAASKTAGVLGDDLALNAQQVSGVVAKRELPVVWAVAKGSFVNKLILVPAALALNHFAKWAVMPLLMIGGAYLCYEGVEKLVHHFAHRKEKKTVAEAQKELAELEAGEVDEKGKIKGAIRTDFVLSAEIIVISLGVVALETFAKQAMVLSAIAMLMTVGVYGLVAAIVKLDDLGLLLSQRKSSSAQGVGRFILWGAPYLMKGLSVVGTAAMFLVGGQIVVHGIGPVHHWFEHLVASWGGLGKSVAEMLFNGLFGVAAGAVVLAIVHPLMKLRGKPAH